MGKFQELMGNDLHYLGRVKVEELIKLFKFEYGATDEKDRVVREWFY